jgi:hypothetical protein
LYTLCKIIYHAFIFEGKGIFEEKGKGKGSGKHDLSVTKNYGRRDSIKIFYSLHCSRELLTIQFENHLWVGTKINTKMDFLNMHKPFVVEIC